MDRVSVSVLDWIEGLNGFETADDVWLKFLGFSNRYGFSAGVVFDQPNYKWAVSDILLSESFPASWRERYITEDYLMRDPIVKALARTRQPFTWAESLEFAIYARADRDIVYEAAEHGLHRGFVVPLARPRTRQAAITMAGEGQNLSRRDRSELHCAALYAHARISALSFDKTRGGEPPQLSRRERECLQWAAMGKSDWEIGEILTIAAGTAGWHIERAKKKLGVSTRIQAVVVALQSGAISV